MMLVIEVGVFFSFFLFTFFGGVGIDIRLLFSSVYLKKQLENYIKVLEVKTRLLRMGQRGGLVPARQLGAKHAQGDVLTFLDAHCECSHGWMEPLLQRIKHSPKSVVCPVIDIISDDNFSYTKTFENHWGAFNWQLSFRWFATERTGIPYGGNTTETIRTPAMAGGLFAIDRKYFFEMGAYDEDMKVIEALVYKLFPFQMPLLFWFFF